MSPVRVLKLLVVAESTVDRRKIHACLAKSGLACEVDEEQDARRAGLLARTTKYDCVLLDDEYSEEGSSGHFDKALDIPCTRRPAIVLLGTGNGDAAATSIARGAQEYINKSAVNADVLRTKIERAVEQTVAARQVQRRETHRSRLMLYDPVTKLPNKRLFSDRLRQATREAARSERRFALIVIKLHGYATIVDQIGTHAGDQVLAELAKRMGRVVRVSDTVGVIRPGKFAVLLPTADSAEGAVIVAEKLRDCLRRPFALPGRTLLLRMSMGIALFPEHGNNFGRLFQCANHAVSAAREDESEISVFGIQPGDEAMAAAQLTRDFIAAVDTEQFGVWYQPQIELASGRIVGAEALVRWQHPTLGLLTPSIFLPTAQHSVAIEKLSVSVYGDAVDQIQQWREAGLNLDLSVNFSTRALVRPQIREQLITKLEETNLAPDRIHLELREGDLTGCGPNAVDALRELAGHGLQLTVDNVGSERLALTRLQELPLRRFKLDKAFVVNNMNADENAAVAACVLAIANSLGATVSAEGIEDEVSWHKLRSLGYRMGQGFAIGDPMDPVTFTRWHAHWTENVARCRQPVQSARAA